MYFSVSQEINVCVDSKAKCMDAARIILSRRVYEADPPIILDHSLIRNDGESEGYLFEAHYRSTLLDLVII
jgi:hypothetical protein